MFWSDFGDYLGRPLHLVQHIPILRFFVGKLAQMDLARNWFFKSSSSKSGG